MFLRKIQQNISLYRDELKEKGIKYFLTARFKKTIDIVLFQYKKYTKSKQTFSFHEKTYYYLIHNYNFAWRNERTVEVPIVWNIIQNNKWKNILEVGNVLSHYYPITHTVVDKYELGQGVVNQDIISFHPKQKYDYIIAISTLEHVGWDELPQDPTKTKKVIQHLKTLLSPKGRLVITLPLGYYNPLLNKQIQKHELGFSEEYYLKRLSKNNIWQEVSWASLRNIQYNTPFPNANGILIGIFSN